MSTTNQAPSRWNPIPLSKLTSNIAGLEWIWEGMLAKKRITLLSAVAKAGKTTLLTFLFRAMASGAPLLGSPVRPGRVVIVSEETADEWCLRRDRYGLGDHIEAICVPFLSKPSNEEWLTVLRDGWRDVQKRPIDLIVFDTLSHLWPVREENSNSDMQEALMPLRKLSEAGPAILLIHHSGAAGERSRGATELEGFVDQVCHFKPTTPGDAECRSRFLTARGRLSGAPATIRATLDDAGETYIHESGTIRPVQLTHWQILERLVPRELPGWTVEEFRINWPDQDNLPTYDTLSRTIGRNWAKAGWQRIEGAKYTYWKPSRDADDRGSDSRTGGTLGGAGVRPTSGEVISVGSVTQECHPGDTPVF